MRRISLNIQGIVLSLFLARIRKASPGNDNILRHQLAEVVTMLVNMSIDLGVVPFAWRTAVITHVPKCTTVGGVNKLTPISETPILSLLINCKRPHLPSNTAKMTSFINMGLNQRAALLRHLLI